MGGYDISDCYSCTLSCLVEYLRGQFQKPYPPVDKSEGIIEIRITVKKTLTVYCIEAFAHLFISLSPFYHCSKLKTKGKASLFQLTFFRSKKFWHLRNFTQILRYWWLSVYCRSSGGNNNYHEPSVEKALVNQSAFEPFFQFLCVKIHSRNCT